MKKILIVAIAALSFASCSKPVITETARTESVPYVMYNATVADLEAAKARITYTLKPSPEMVRGGLENCKQAAIQEALTANGNADLLLEPQFVVNQTKGFLGFGKKVHSVTVSGRPAFYKNFRSLNDDIWTNPVFRGNYKKKESSIFRSK